jgi:hypothetical protein
MPKQKNASPVFAVHCLEFPASFHTIFKCVISGSVIHPTVIGSHSPLGQKGYIYCLFDADPKNGQCLGAILDDYKQVVEAGGEIMVNREFAEAFRRDHPDLAQVNLRDLVRENS